MEKQSAKMQDEVWDDLRLVLFLARAGTYSDAAERLGVNESTVARRLAQAENRWRARLFDRVNGKLTPTPDGDDLVRHGEIVETQMQAARSAVLGADDRAAGLVRVTAVPFVANRLLAPALGVLIEANPALEIDLIADPRDFSLTRREVDIALRLARPSTENVLITRRIATLDFALYAKRGCDPQKLPVIGYEEARRGLPQAQWLDAFRAKRGQRSAPVRIGDAETLLACVRAGAGQSLLPTMLGDADRGLQRVGDGVPVVRRDLWLLVHPDLRPLVRVRTVIDWIDGIFRSASTQENSGASESF
ncbi:MAG: LysR family transcriptional regulator [Pseudomonadota bacterium]